MHLYKSPSYSFFFVEALLGGSKLDQNTMTVLTTRITVLGTLGGVVLGVVLSNRYAFKNERAKRDNVAIEEIYTLVTQVSKKCFDPIDKQQSFNKAISNDLKRARTLVMLYLPPLLRDRYDIFTNSLVDVAEEIEKMDPKEKVNQKALLRNPPPSLEEYFSNYHLLSNCTWT